MAHCLLSRCQRTWWNKMISLRRDVLAVISHVTLPIVVGERWPVLVVKHAGRARLDEHKVSAAARVNSDLIFWYGRFVLHF